jgi:hypothetical protein
LNSYKDGEYDLDGPVGVLDDTTVSVKTQTRGGDICGGTERRNGNVQTLAAWISSTRRAAAGPILRWFAALGVALVGLAVLTSPSASATTSLVGTFELAPGNCSGAAPSGSYFRMVTPNGSNASGPYFTNGNSSCSDQTYTPLTPGSDGGLLTGGYQAQPSPDFDSSGNSLSGRIMAPSVFEGVKFGVATDATDPQTADSVPPPSVVANGSTLSGNLSSWGVGWNNQYFNQGAPKPDGTLPGNTTAVTGTYDSATGAYELQWSSLIVGGPFNGFTGLWILAGTFEPAASTTTTTTAPPTTPTTAAPSGAKTTGGASTSAAPGSTTAAKTTAGGTTSTGSGSGNTSAAKTTTTTTRAGGTTTTTSATGSGTASQAKTDSGSHKTAVALSSTRSSGGSGGSGSSTWLIVLIVVVVLAAAAALGFWRIRQRRGLAEPPVEGAAP